MASLRASAASALLPLALTALAPATALAQDQGVFDNHKSRWHNHNVEPMQGLIWSEDSTTLYILNQTGARLTAVDRASQETLWELPIGPGASNIVRRPGTQELWIADRVTGVLQIVDPATRQLTDTIQVGALPYGLDFTEDGLRAYVACAGVDRVDVVDVAQKQVVNSIHIPAREPRALLRLGDAVYVASHLSGNGTAPISNDGTAGESVAKDVVNTNEVEGVTPLPDRDLFRIAISADPTTDVLDTAWTRSGIGTFLLNINPAQGQGRMWVPNTDALNATFRGERAFVGGQVVRNRLAIVSVDRIAPVYQVDLDLLITEPDKRCAPPTGVAMNAAGDVAYVCGYGSSNITVLGMAPTPHWIGEIDIVQARNNPAVSVTDRHNGAGPRTCRVSPDGTSLAVLNSGENSYSLIDLADLPEGTEWTYEAPPATFIGWDPLPKEIVQGRLDFARTRNSLSGTSSCASCHAGGHTDMLAWDLGVFLDDEGTPRNEVGHALDNKGPLVTQSVRSLREVGPWHWRGEKRSLFEFDGAFMGLLERTVDGELQGLGANINYLTRYMDSLSWPANPHQNADRSLTAAQAQGRDLFNTLPVLGALTCADCHQLPLGTSGEVVSHGLGGMSPTAVVPPLRGVGEKEMSPEFVVGGDFGTRTELGVGLGHTGTFSSITDHILQLSPDGTQRMTVTPAQADLIAEFLRALDTGLAPSTARQVTLNAANLNGQDLADFNFLLSEAGAGNCDLVLHYGPISFGGKDVYPGAMFDSSRSTFRQNSAALADLTVADVIALAATTPVTIQGVPLWEGQPRGLDRDNDLVLDLDEQFLGTDPEHADTDRDGQPDGYEIQGGSNPLSRKVRTRDNRPPSIQGSVSVVYVTQTATKIEFTTDELTQIGVAVDDNIPQLRAPIWPLFDNQFSVVVNELTPGTSHTLQILLRDPAGNLSTATHVVTTPDRALPTPVHVESGSISVSGPLHNQIAQIQVELLTSDGAAAQTGYSVRGRLYHVSPTGIQVVSETLQTWLVQTDGMAYFTAFVPPTIAPGMGAFVFAIDRIDGLPGRPDYVVAENQTGPIWEPY